MADLDFTDLPDLAAEELGGAVLLANDEFFAPKENLLKPHAAEWREQEYTDRGKWMDGWETRRRREPGYDWCTVRLGLPGEAKGEACDGCPPLERLFQQFEDGGGELWLCPICLNARGLQDEEKVAHAKVAGATPMCEWAGDDTTVFSY